MLQPRSGLPAEATSSAAARPWPHLAWVPFAAGVVLTGCVGVLQARDGMSAGEWSQTIAAGTYLAAGLLGTIRRPESRVGSLLVAFGWTQAVAGLASSGVPLLHTIGQTAFGWYAIPLVGLLLGFPTGRVVGVFDRRLLRVVIVDAVVIPLVMMLVYDSRDFGADRQLNLLLVRSDLDAYFTLNLAVNVVGAAVALVVLSRIVWRWRRGTEVARRALAPVLSCGAAAAVLVAGVLATVTYDTEVTAADLIGDVVFGLALVLPPLGFLRGLQRSRPDRSAVAELMIGLHALPAGDVLRDTLARALRDPSLAVGYWDQNLSAYVDANGVPLELPDREDESRAATVLDRGGQRLAVLVHDALLREDTGRLDAVAAAAALVVERDRLRQELAVQLVEVRESRMRLVTAADTARQRLERDLHDGAQERLLAASVALQRVQLRLVGGPDGEGLGALVEEAKARVEEALRELRELARGLHPVVLTERGLEAAIEQLGQRSALPLRVVAALRERLPAAVEAAAYFVIAEALTNASKHADASRAWVELRRDGDVLHVEVGDDGIGGAELSNGTGLRGLADRVGALDGHIVIDSAPGRGTRIVAELPCAS